MKGGRKERGACARRNDGAWSDQGRFHHNNCARVCVCAEEQSLSRSRRHFLRTSEEVADTDLIETPNLAPRELTSAGSWLGALSVRFLIESRTACVAAASAARLPSTGA